LAFLSLPALSVERSILGRIVPALHGQTLSSFRGSEEIVQKASNFSEGAQEGGVRGGIHIQVPLLAMIRNSHNNKTRLSVSVALVQNVLFLAARRSLILCGQNLRTHALKLLFLGSRARVGLANGQHFGSLANQCSRSRES